MKAKLTEFFMSKPQGILYKPQIGGAGGWRGWPPPPGREMALFVTIYERTIQWSTRVTLSNSLLVESHVYSSSI
jgi:hypothetical protein